MRNLRLAPPPPDDAEQWKHLFNHLFLCEEDDLCEWLRYVRVAVEEHEKQREERAA